MLSCLEEKKSLFPAEIVTVLIFSSLKSSLISKMKILFAIFAVAFCFAVGQALTCYQCQAGILNLCLTSQYVCQPGEQCFSGNGKAAGIISVKTKGCLAVAKCNMTTDETYSIGSANATVYKVTKTCCNTDLCNAAPGLPAAPALSLALATVSALLVANIMV